MKLRIIDPKEEKPGFFERFLNAGSLEGCFLIILVINLIILIIQYIVGFFVKQKDITGLSFTKKSSLLKIEMKNLSSALVKVQQ